MLFGALVDGLRGKSITSQISSAQDSFSSNFIAGRKGSVFMREMWVKQKKMITQHCPLSDKSKEIVCCFDDPKFASSLQ